MGAVSALGALVAVTSGIATFGFWFFFIGWIVKPRPHLAPKTAPIYAVGMGFGIGLMSEQAEMMFPGIVIQAVSLTFFVAASLLFAYKSGIIKPTKNFLLIIFSCHGWDFSHLYSKPYLFRFHRGLIFFSLLIMALLASG